uniref:Histone-lysine N-methyltransferase, H3 lysine-79 specific-like n=1 Tax=Diabrotica virgifera virgifera TaxID=50390 RepID=A0A6P7GHF9_DIAVI
MATENINFKEAEQLHNNPNYAKITTNNRFAILNNITNFPSLPNPTNNTSNFTLNNPAKRFSNTTNTANKRKATSPPILPHSSASTSKRPTPKSNPIIPNPYRDEFIDYKEKLILLVTSHINQLIDTTNQSQPICNLENELRKLISNNLEDTGTNTETDNIGTILNDSSH